MVIFRWIAFFLAIVSVYILTRPEVTMQWVGWLFSALSCTLWVMIAYRDRDLPRGLMEVLYTIMAIWGIINWYGY
tara:strand:+ start:877 stop:1101 length:225 start_codon:yes stop_codon:yes gene_type:complete